MDQSTTNVTTGNTAGLITAFLADSDARCPVCRYALRGCTSDKCPECGGELELAISGAPAAPAPTLWHASVYGCGVTVFLTLVMLANLFQSVLDVLQNPNLLTLVQIGRVPQSTLPQWSPIFGIVFLCLLACLLLAWVVRHRRDFGRWPLSMQLLVGVICWMSPVIMLGAIALVTR